TMSQTNRARPTTARTSPPRMSSKPLTRRPPMCGFLGMPFRLNGEMSHQRTLFLKKRLKRIDLFFYHHIDKSVVVVKYPSEPTDVEQIPRVSRIVSGDPQYVPRVQSTEFFPKDRLPS